MVFTVFQQHSCDLEGISGWQEQEISISCSSLNGKQKPKSLLLNTS